MTEKYPANGDWKKPWWWGLTAGQQNHVPDGPYASTLDKIYRGHHNNSLGKPFSDAVMDTIACNLALAMKK